MIIKSGVKTFGFWLSVVSVIGGVIVCFYIPFNHNQTPIQGKIFLYFVLLLLIGIYGKLLWDCNKLLINTDSKTITFKNRLTNKEITFPFGYFDGYIVSYQPTKIGSAKNIYLIKNKIFIKRICSFTYSNMSELENSLIPIKNLGSFQFSYWKSIKILFKKSVID